MAIFSRLYGMIGDSRMINTSFHPSFSSAASIYFHFFHLLFTNDSTQSRNRYLASRNASACPIDPPSHTASSPRQNPNTNPAPMMNTTPGMNSATIAV